MTDLATWLEQQGLGKYAQLFAAHQVDLEVLSDLTEEDLDRLGLPLGPRKKLFKAAKSLRAPDADRARQLAETRAGADGERRQLTVLFCDLVGYAELALRLDPEVLQGIVRCYEDTCAACGTRYAGYVFPRLGTRAAGEVLGAAHFDPSCATVAKSGQAQGGV